MTTVHKMIVYLSLLSLPCSLLPSWATASRRATTTLGGRSAHLVTPVKPIPGQFSGQGLTRGTGTQEAFTAQTQRIAFLKQTAKIRAQEAKERARVYAGTYVKQLKEDPFKGAEKGYREKERQEKAPIKKWWWEDQIVTPEPLPAQQQPHIDWLNSPYW